MFNASAKPSLITVNRSPVTDSSSRRKRNGDGDVPQTVPDWDLDVPSEPQPKTKKGPGNFRFILRKEVIQPQVPLRLPCYDFTPVADPTVVVCPQQVSLPVSETPSGKANSHGVTGGVYKARERIHRGMLIHDY
jgi:hypothetical protein